MASDVTAEVEEELLALQSIYEDKLTLEDVENGTEIKITIHPATGDDVASQYVYLNILFILPRSYPEEPPEIGFTASRGLSDHHLNNLLKRMQDFANERTGECILFDLMEMAKDILTSNNIPSCPCSICLMGFHECDDFLKTECYHYFHSYCLNQYIEHLISQATDAEKNSSHKTSSEYVAPCPVCRLSVTVQLAALRNAQPPINDDAIVFDDGVLERHKKLHDDHYRRQLEKGGLIDLEQEKNKYLLSSIEQRYKTQKAMVDETGTEDGKADTKNDDVAAANSHKNNHCAVVNIRKSGKTVYKPPKNANYKDRHRDKWTQPPINGNAKTITNNESRNQAPQAKGKRPAQQRHKNEFFNANERWSKHENNYNRNKQSSQNRNWRNSRTASGKVGSSKETVPSKPAPKSPQCSRRKETPSPSRERVFKGAVNKKVDRPPGFPLKPPPGFENVKPVKQISLPGIL